MDVRHCQILVIIWFIQLNIGNNGQLDARRQKYDSGDIIISNNVVCTISKGSDQPAHTHSLIRAFASRLNIL